MNTEIQLADLARRVANMIRIGRVAEVDHTAARVRVQSGDLLTEWLPWQTRRAGNTRTWCPPTVGEQVMIFSPSGEPAAGMVIAALYCEDRPAPDDSADTHVIEFPDGTVIRYDHASSELDITAVATVRLTAPNTYIVGNVIHSGGDLSSNGIVLHTHTHSDVQPGGGSTGGPQ